MVERNRFATPKMIQDRIENPDEMEPADLVNLMLKLPEISARFTSGKGNPKTQDLKRFRRSLGVLMGDYTVSQLLQISDDCIDREGRVIESELKKILEDTEGI